MTADECRCAFEFMIQKRTILVVSLVVIVALAVVAASIWRREAPPQGRDIPSLSLPGVATSALISTNPDTSNWKTYRNDQYGFALKYPPDYEVEERSSINARYEKDFHFKTRNAKPLVLRVTDLNKYLPLTNTPTLQEYLQTLRRLERFKEATIGDRHAYEYLICGRAACSQEVAFISDGRQYQFSIQYGAYFPNGKISGDVDPRSITFESAPRDIQEIVKSLESLPAH